MSAIAHFSLYKFSKFKTIIKLKNDQRKMACKYCGQHIKRANKRIHIVPKQKNENGRRPNQSFMKEWLDQ